MLSYNRKSQYIFNARVIKNKRTLITLFQTYTSLPFIGLIGILSNRAASRHIPNPISPIFDIPDTVSS